MHSSSEVRFVLVFTMFFRCWTFYAWNVRDTQKFRKNTRFGLENRGPGRPGEVRTSRFKRQNDQVGRQSALEAARSSRARANRAGQGAHEGHFEPARAPGAFRSSQSKPDRASKAARGSQIEPVEARWSQQARPGRASRAQICRLDKPRRGISLWIGACIYASEVAFMNTLAFMNTTSFA